MVQMAGRVARVESTKAAKARYRRSGGQQWTPTRGQLNAAEIWNKQEEQLRKSREREERKKREAQKQAQKDARHREVQQEMLRKGRITIEDTWGKISASQNRLHRFFGPTGGQSEGSISKNDEPVTLLEAKANSTNHEAQSEDDIIQKEKVLENGQISSQNYMKVTKYAPNSERHQSQEQPDAVSQEHKSRKRKRDSCTTDALSENLAEHSVDLVEELPMAPFQSVSQREQCLFPLAPKPLMPPPPRPATQNNETQTLQQPTTPNQTCMRSDHPRVDFRSQNESVRSPLSEMSMSQLNSRCMEKSNPENLVANDFPRDALNKSYLMSTQVLNETILGLSSQDLEDDLDEENKENSSPLRSAAPATAKKFPNQRNCLRSPKALVNFDIQANSSLDIAMANDLRELNDDYDEFGDPDLDDEDLLSLAATQRLEQDLRDSTASQVCASGNYPINVDGAKGNGNPITASRSESKKLRSSDSFAFSGVDEEDLIECLQNFEEDHEDLANPVMMSLLECFEQDCNDQTDGSHTKRKAPPCVNHTEANKKSKNNPFNIT